MTGTRAPKISPTPLASEWGFSCPNRGVPCVTATQYDAGMSAPTQRISAQLAADLADCLHRLRIARHMNNERDERVFEMRLNWLIDKIRLEKPC